MTDILWWRNWHAYRYGELVLILVVVLLLFGSKRLRGIGADLSAAIKGFRESIREAGRRKRGKAAGERAEKTAQGRIIEGETISDEPDTKPLRKQQPKV